MTVLRNLGVSDAADGIRFLAQAFWLAVRVAVPVDDSVTLAGTLIKRLGPGADAAPLIATAACFIVQTRGESHPEREEIQKAGIGLLAACAQERQVAEDKFTDWIAAQGLNDPRRVRSALDQAIETLVGDENWCFDREEMMNDE